MQSRRQAKMASLVKETVSDIIAQHLSDPRIKGLVSVTRVNVSPDLRNADVFISIFGQPEAGQKVTFGAIQHARGKIQSMLGDEMKKTKFCPVIKFHRDLEFKKTLETFEILDKVSEDLENDQ